MEYRTTDELRRVADLFVAGPPTAAMSRAERLERWAKLLAEGPRQHLNTLNETEYQPPEARDAMRCDNSPIWVAFADPLLRAEGMRSDSYGEAKRFFDLRDREMHDILCYCNWGATMTADSAAQRINAIAHGRPGVFTRAWLALVG